MHNARRIARFVGSFGRIALAVALLGGLWVGTVQGVERASRQADERRAADRATVANGYAHALSDWLDAGKSEALSLSREVFPGAGVTTALQTFVSEKQTFTRDAIVFNGPTVIAATQNYDILVNNDPKPCVTTGESGGAQADTHLTQLVAAARAARGPVVSPIFSVPGTCRSAVGVAISTNRAVLVVLGDLQDATQRVMAASYDNARLFVVTGGVALDPQNGIVTPPTRVASFVQRVSSGGPQVTRYPFGTTSILAAYAPVAPGWSVVLEQDAADFDIQLQQQPSVIVASILTVVFAIVFALIAFFDIRRRRAHRRAEVAKNAFFSIAGHELRTPLTVLKGFAETLSANWGALDDERRRTLVERMVPQTRRLDRLVERLLVAASIQAETHARPKPVAVDVLPIVREAVDQFRTQAPLHTFSVRAATKETIAEADPAALDQVLQHLIENAVKYSPSGGSVLVEVVADDDLVGIYVDDEGIGLPSDYRRIFDKFAQGESVTKRVHDEGGVGLGLYIVRTLVEEMGGSVRAEPREPNGASFVVALRRAAKTGVSEKVGLVRASAG